MATWRTIPPFVMLFVFFTNVVVLLKSKKKRYDPPVWFYGFCGALHAPFRCLSYNVGDFAEIKTGMTTLFVCMVYCLVFVVHCMHHSAVCHASSCLSTRPYNDGDFAEIEKGKTILFGCRVVGLMSLWCIVCTIPPFVMLPFAFQPQTYNDGSCWNQKWYAKHACIHGMYMGHFMNSLYCVQGMMNAILFLCKYMIIVTKVRGVQGCDPIQVWVGLGKN